MGIVQHLYVDINKESDSTDNTYLTVEEAINDATEKEVTIHVGNGIYPITCLQKLSVPNKKITIIGEDANTTLEVKRSNDGTNVYSDYFGELIIQKLIITPNKNFIGDTRVISYSSDKHMVKFKNVVFKTNNGYPKNAWFYVYVRGTSYNNKSFYNCLFTGQLLVNNAGSVNLYNCAVEHSENGYINILNQIINNIEYDKDYQLINFDNDLFGVFSGNLAWKSIRSFFLIEQNSKYYSINPEYYKDEQYQSLSLKSEEYPNNNDFNKYGFNNLNELLKEYKKSNIKSSGSDLGFGKVFSFKIDDNFKCVSNLELVGETLKWSNDVTDSLKKENFTSSKYHTGRYNYIPYLAFDNHIDNNGMTGFQIKNPSDKDWLKIDFAKPVRPSKLTLQGNAGDVSVCVPKKIEISMSNDDINYTIIDTIDNIIKDDKYNEYVYKKPNKKYRYLKIRFLEFYSSVWCTINQMEFFESLYVEKYLIQDKNLNLYTYKDDTLTKLDNNSVTESNFKGNGFTEIEVITREMLLNQFGNLENIKLLLWTDNINKEECIMEYHLKKPLRPIDILKKSNSGKFDIVMMEI